MKAIPRLWLSLCFVIVLAGSAFGDSWLPPREFEVPSANGKLVARIVPKEQGAASAHAIVYRVGQEGRQEFWRTELSNRVSPTRAFISDDGGAVVTMDNWGGVGYGDDVVAIYGQKGLLAKYSLEQFAPPPPRMDPQPDKNGAVRIRLGDHEPYQRKFSHSTSSRHWRTYNREAFISDSRRTLFCIWLDWDERWVAWNTSDGRLVTVDRPQTERWNLLERDRALEEIKSGKGYAAAYNFLGRTKFKEDRPLIEELLKDTEFGSGSRHTGSGDSGMSFTYTSGSHKREEADRILACWDGLIRDERPGWHDQYFFLGTVQGQVHLPREPQKCRTLRIYLIPAEVPLERWAERQPQQYLTADLAHGPYRFENCKHVDVDVGDIVNFAISGITPGSYRLKAVWDSAAPFCESKGVLCLPSAGDYVSASSSVFEAKKGVVTEGLRLECTQIVK